MKFFKCRTRGLMTLTLFMLSVYTCLAAGHNSDPETTRTFKIFKHQKHPPFILHRAYEIRDPQNEQEKGLRLVLAPMKDADVNKDLGHLLEHNSQWAVRTNHFLNANVLQNVPIGSFDSFYEGYAVPAGLGEDLQLNAGLNGLDQETQENIVSQITARPDEHGQSTFIMKVFCYFKGFCSHRAQGTTKILKTPISSPSGSASTFPYGALVVHTPESNAVNDVLLEMSVGVNNQPNHQVHRFISRIWPFTWSQWKNGKRQTGLVGRQKRPLSIALHCASLLAFRNRSFFVNTDENWKMAEIIYKALGLEPQENWYGETPPELAGLCEELLEEDEEFGRKKLV